VIGGYGERKRAICGESRVLEQIIVGYIGESDVGEGRGRWEE
jgi:hypothetical protein